LLLLCGGGGAFRPFVRLGWIARARFLTLEKRIRRKKERSSSSHLKGYTHSNSNGLPAIVSYFLFLLFRFFFNFSGGLSLEFLNPISTGAEFEYGAIL
jgi:hypothetical protein